MGEISPKLFQVIGDNLDLIINVRQKSCSNKNKDFHWFNLYAILDDVSGSHLPNIHQRRFLDVPLREFLPGNFVRTSTDFTLLCAKIIE